VTNAEVVDRTHQESLTTQIQRRRFAVFGHVRRVPDTTLADSALRLSIVWSGLVAGLMADHDGSDRVDPPDGARPWNSGIFTDIYTVWNDATHRDVWRALCYSRSCGPVSQSVSQ